MKKRIDRTGIVKGKLTVIKYAGVNKFNKGLWLCSCTCGGEVTVTWNYIAHAKWSVSCGCNRKDKQLKAGMVFGRLTTNYISGNTSAGTIWRCSCSCGGVSDVLTTRLKNGTTTSCGCYARELTSARAKTYVKDKHWRWNSNISEEERKLSGSRDYLEYNLWRSAVYTRDNFTCQCCGNATGNNLNAHHLEDYASNPDLRTEVDNGVTLCKNCHTEFHKIYGKDKQTYAWQFLEFIQTPLAA